jgi:acyl-[acyl-carrier-protein]-phospholipid O-acyltransferase/long-chain-fatty-acid--[acyl-carrier-protein] ligase
MKEYLSLLFSRRFGPLFCSQFLGAFNDNFFKNAILVFILYRLAEKAGINGEMLMPLASALFVLPYFLFSATAGQMADHFQKATMIRWTKAAEIGVMVVGATALMVENIYAMMAVLFLLGNQATFFGPLKYAILPEELKEKELMAGNALIEGGTFIAILLGTIAGGLLVMIENGPMLVAATMIGVAFVGWLFALLVPKTGTATKSVGIGYNVVTETYRILRYVASDKALFLPLLGISWFWLIGAAFLTEFPPFAKDVLGGDQKLVTLFMTVFSVGIAIGSAACGRILKGEISAKFVPVASIGVALFSFDLWASTHSLSPQQGLTVEVFLSTFTGIRITADLFLLSVAGGLYATPLYAIMQVRAEESHRARVIAANNIMNAALMTSGAMFLTACLAMGLTIPQIFLALAGMSMVSAVYICKLLPRELFKTVAAFIFRRLYRVEVTGLEKLEGIDGPIVFVANHVSWLDGPLMNAFMPGETAFAINTFVFKKWWGSLSKYFANMIPVDPTNPMSTKTMIRAVEDGKRLVIFPEGRLTVTGSIMKVYDGPAVIADKAKATLVPVKLDGVQFHPLNRLKGKMPQRRFPKITIAIQDPVKLDLPEDVKGRERRKVAGQRLYDVMSRMMFQTRRTDITLFESLLDASAIHGKAKGIVEDTDCMSRPLPYGKLVVGSHALGSVLARRSQPGEYVGVLLPNAVGTVATFFALQATGRIPAMLNFSVGTDSLLATLQAAQIKLVLTSKKFVAKAKGMDEVVAAIAKVAQVVYLEDLKTEIGLGTKLLALVKAKLGKLALPKVNADSPAVVLFTSGSEGTPKGVVLRHRNILSNIAQIGARFDYNPTDRVFNALPVFHSFGLTGGLLLPVLSGIKTFMYPSPLHYKIVPELAYDTNATVIFGTNTFLKGYARFANPYDFYSVRCVIAGGEKVEAETRQTYGEKFGLRIFEGYGATECAPVLAINTPMHFKAGSVGRMLPGIETKMEAVPGIDDGQRLHIRGPNIMLGYLKTDKPGVIQPLEDGWYDTGDIVAIDNEGFVKIVGRAKRFIKIGGEMVSLTAIEVLAAQLWPQSIHAAVGIPDPKKGEQAVLITNQAGATRADLLALAREKGINELLVPKTVMVVDKVPLLGTGKIDYVTAQKLALASDSEAKAA